MLYATIFGPHVLCCVWIDSEAHSTFQHMFRFLSRTNTCACIHRQLIQVHRRRREKNGKNCDRVRLLGIEIGIISTHTSVKTLLQTKHRHTLNASTSQVQISDAFIFMQLAVQLVVFVVFYFTLGEIQKFLSSFL